MRTRHWLAGGGLVALAITAITFFLVRFGVSNVVGSGQADAERNAVSTLRTLHWAQGLFRQGGFVDADGNGVTEFGTMRQLASLAPLPGGDRVPSSLLPGAGTGFRGETMTFGGYCFRYDLPEGAHARERRFVAFAWPADLHAGRRIYCIDQNENIYESANAAGIAGCEAGPPAGACPRGAPGPGWVRWRGKTNQHPVGFLGP